MHFPPVGLGKRILIRRHTVKQFQTQYEDEAGLIRWLEDIRAFRERDGHARRGCFFHIYTDSSNYAYVEPVVAHIRALLPDALYAGITCNGSIVQGASATTHVSVYATIYERDDSRVEVVQLPLTYEAQEDTAKRLLEIIAERPWIKAIEMMTTVGHADLPEFCRAISDMPDDIQFYGGGALAADVFDGHSEDNFVFSSAGSHSAGCAAFILRGGEGLHVETRFLTGWRRLGMPFEVTAAHNNVLETLDGTLALEQYQRYLGMTADEHFFDLAVVFPFCFETDGTEYLRVATNYTPEGSLLMGADVKEHTVGNIAYGDPVQIKRSVNENLARVHDFQPDVIQLFSCGSRQLYWGSEVDRETLPFNGIAPTSGFYTAGELFRAKHDILLHNVAMVIAALREGDPDPTAVRPLPQMETEGFSRPLMINNCLTTFINVAAEELRQANEKLSRMAITDGLTGLLNRTEIERRIHKALADYKNAPGDAAPPIVVMMDLDFFKTVNDTYGHQEGDEVLREISKIFNRYVENKDYLAAVGRWGGEEFMFLLKDMDVKQASQFANEIRGAAAAVRFGLSGSHTLSAGIAEASPQDTTDTLTERADKGLYLAKEHGRNQIAFISIG